MGLWQRTSSSHYLIPPSSAKLRKSSEFPSLLVICCTQAPNYIPYIWINLQECPPENGRANSFPPLPPTSRHFFSLLSPHLLWDVWTTALLCPGGMAGLCSHLTMGYLTKGREREAILESENQGLYFSLCLPVLPLLTVSRFPQVSTSAPACMAHGHFW